jgi:DNA end-binding protein Ku
LLNPINKKTGNRLKQRLSTPKPARRSKRRTCGYEIGKGQYLQVEDEEIEKIRIESSHHLDRYVCAQN